MVAVKNDAEHLIQPGKSCLLNVMDERFLVQILEVAEHSLRVSFPGQDYPVEGMRVHLEFHDENGFDSFAADVLQGPNDGSNSILLQRPTANRRTRHRRSCRVPTDLTVQVKDQVHVRKYDAEVLNLSGGGALISSEGPFDFSTTLEMTLSIPGEPICTVHAHIIHIAPSGEGHQGAPKFFGLRFIDVEPAVAQCLHRYIARRLRELYPSE